LRALEAAGVIAREPLAAGRGNRYRLTEAGREFQTAIDALGAWGQRWTVRVDRRNLDPGFPMWNMRRRIARERLPERRVVVRTNLRGVAPAYRGVRIFWLVLERERVDLCVEDPGFEVDLYVEADLAAMAKVWLGDVTFDRVLRSGEVRLAGPRALARAFPTWLMLSKFAGVPRPEGAAAQAQRQR
jgi:hypothetical protein